MAKELSNIVSVNLTDEQFNFLKAYCYKHELTYSYALRKFVKNEMQLNELLSNEDKIRY